MRHGECWSITDSYHVCNEYEVPKQRHAHGPKTLAITATPPHFHHVTHKLSTLTPPPAHPPTMASSAGSWLRVCQVCTQRRLPARLLLLLQRRQPQQASAQTQLQLSWRRACSRAMLCTVASREVAGEYVDKEVDADFATRVASFAYSDEAADGSASGADVSGAMKMVLSTMQQHRVRPGVKTWTALIFTFARAWSRQLGGGSDLPNAWKVYERAVEQGVTPDVRLFAALGLACARYRGPDTNGGADVDGAWRVLKLLREAGLTPNWHIYSLLASACRYAKTVHGGADVERAATIPAMARADGLDPAADPKSAGIVYRSLIAACAASKHPRTGGKPDLAQAQAFVRDLMEAGVPIGAEVWQAMLQLVATKQGLQDATALNLIRWIAFEGMPAAAAADGGGGGGSGSTHNSNSNVMLYNQMIHGCAHRRVPALGNGCDVELAWELYEAIGDANLQPTRVTFLGLAQACANSRLPQHSHGADVAGALQTLQFAIEELVRFA